MTGKRLVPVNMSREDLLYIIDDIRAGVGEGDSFEGFLNYLIPDDPDAPADSFDVEARYRVGNLQGQGGMEIVGTWQEVHDEDPGDGSEAVDG